MRLWGNLWWENFLLVRVLGYLELASFCADSRGGRESGEGGFGFCDSKYTRFPWIIIVSKDANVNIFCWLFT